MKRKSLLFMLLFALMAPWAAMGQETLTVNEGTATSYYAPMYVFYWDDYTRAQTVFPASQLEDMDGGTITAITFYTTSSNIPYTSAATYDAYLAEVSSETISAYIDRSAATTVISGATAEFVSDGNGGGMITITLATPYVYGGGNLLFGCDNNTDAGYKTIYFYGVSGVSGASISGSNGSAGGSIPVNQRNFLPKTTFTYTPGTSTGCAKPRQLAVNYTGGLTATATWTGEASGYDVELNGVVIATNVTGTSYPISGLQLATTYSVRVRGNCGGGDVSDWTNAQTFTTDLCMPEDMCELTFVLEDSYGDGWNNNKITVKDVETNEILAVMEAPTHGGGNVATSDTYTLGVCDGRELEFSWTTGSYIGEVSYTVTDINGEVIVEGSGAGFTTFTYTVSCAVTDCRKPTDLVATEVGKRSATLSWTENGDARAWNLMVNGQPIENIEDNPYTLTGLDPETTYTVQVSPVCEVEKWSDEISFTTLVACPTPTELSVDSLTPFSATLHWTGDASQYIVKYRPVVHGAVLESIDFDDNSMGGWTTIDADGDGYDWVLGSACDGIYLDGGDLGGTGHESSADLVTSGSYTNTLGDYPAGILTPDNYLVSPQVTLGGSITFWACAQDSGYPDEVFGVAVSTTGNTDAADFTTISTWTMTAKGVGAPTMYTRSGNRAQGAWYPYTVDLSDYSGQGYVAIRHFNSSDNFLLNVDDIVIEGAASEAAWTTETVTENRLPLAGLSPEIEYEWQVQAVCGGEDGSSLWAYSTFTTPSNCDAPFNLNVTDLMPTTATLNWTGYQDGFEVAYRPTASAPVLLKDTFEDGTLDNWTLIDADGDGNDWTIATPASYGIGDAYSGTYCASSWSWNSVTLYPDNYMISPLVNGAASITYYVATNTAYPDHYAVMASSTGTDISDFTTVFEEDAYAGKSGNGTKSSMTKAGTRDMSTWAEKNIELPAGTKYVAFRHYNSDDMNYLFIDDVTISGAAGEEQPWETTTTDALFTDIDVDPEITYEWKVRGENRDCGDEGYTEWSEVSYFTTPGLCDNPKDLKWEADGTTVTLSWTGYQDSYDLTYYTPAMGDVVFEDDFLSEGTQIDEWVTTYDEEVDETSGFYWLNSAHTAAGYGFGNAGTITYLISPEFEALEGDAFVEFYYIAGNEDYPEESFKIGYSTTTNDVESFTFGEEYTVTDQGWFDADLPEGTKYFAIQYTSTHTPDPDYADLYVTWFSVVDNYVAPGTPTTLEDVTSPVTIEGGLEPETIYRWEVTGICGDDATTQTVYSYFLTGEDANPTQTITLTEGWNWISLYVEVVDPIEALQMLEAALGDNATMISASEIYTEYLGDGLWIGDLDDEGVYNEQMYMIEAVADCEIELEGTLANAENYTIDINPGWNWIGFPHSEELLLEDALINFAAAEEDQFAEADIYSEYGFGMWIGDIETLVPGHGYMYFYNGEETTPLVYNTFAKARKAGLKAIEKKTDKVTFNRNSIKKMK